MQASIKAANVLNSLAVAREILGEARVHAVMAGLPLGARAELTRRMMADEWIDVLHWEAFLDALHREAFAGDEQRLIEYAKRCCERDFSTVYRFFLRSPRVVLRLAPRIWSTYFDRGVLEVTRDERRGALVVAEIALREFAPCRIFVVCVQAFIEQILIMSGAHDARVAVLGYELNDEHLSCSYEARYRDGR